MKKKITALLLAAVAAIPVLCLTACGDKDDGFDGRKSEKIADAQAWAAAFDFSEVTNVRVTTVGVEGADNKVVAVFDGDKVQYTYSDGEDYNVTEYYEYKRDEIYDDNYPTYGTTYYYTYSEEDEKWTVSKSIIYDVDNASEWISEHLDMIDKYDTVTKNYVSVTERFAEFTYDNSLYAYVSDVSDVDDDIAEGKAYFKFQNGKLVEGQYNFVFNDGEHMDVVFELTDFGSATVELPTVED